MSLLRADAKNVLVANDAELTAFVKFALGFDIADKYEDSLQKAFLKYYLSFS